MVVHPLLPFPSSLYQEAPYIIAMADLAASKENPLAGTADPPKGRLSSGSDDEKQHVMTTIEHMHNHRRLTSRQIQLLAIAGTIGKSCQNATTLSIAYPRDRWKWADAKCSIRVFDYS